MFFSGNKKGAIPQFNRTLFFVNTNCIQATHFYAFKAIICGKTQGFECVYKKQRNCRQKKQNAAAFYPEFVELKVKSLVWYCI